MKNLAIAFTVLLLLGSPAMAGDVPASDKVGLTTYTKAHLIDDFMHCAAYDKIAAECTEGSDAAMAQQYRNASGIAAESAIKLAIAAGVTPDQFRPKLDQIDAQLRGQIGGNCQSTVLAGQYALLCRDLAADAAPRTIYWAERYQAEKKAAAQ